MTAAGWVTPLVRHVPVAAGDPTVTGCTLLYAADDPFYIKLLFIHTDGHVTPWTVGRELFRDAIGHAEAGTGDIKLQRHDDKFLARLWAADRGDYAQVEFALKDITEFYIATLDVRELGTELADVDVDAELDAWLADHE